MPMKSEFNMVYLSRHSGTQECFINYGVVEQNETLCNGQALETPMLVSTWVKTSCLGVVRREVTSSREEL